MWKYVTRRVKDSVERTYNVLDVRRTWTCGGQQDAICPSQPSPQPPVCDDINFVATNIGNESTEKKSSSDSGKPPSAGRLYCPFKRRAAARKASAAAVKRPADASQQQQLVTYSTERKWDKHGQEHFREKFGHRHHCNFQRSFVEAITWSSAIVCGWYTTQLYCMRRRNLTRYGDKNPWTTKCNYARALRSPTQAFHSNLLSPWVLAAPDNSPPPSENANRFWLDANEFKWQPPSSGGKKNVPYEINNDGKTTNKSDDIINAVSQSNLPSSTFDSAVANLFIVHSNIEFRLGVENLDAGEYELAASHFKLATSHCHAGATFNLGICYEQGLGVDRNMKMALECYMAAAAMGHAKATYNVGVFHVHGLAGLKRNRKMAKQYFVAAAKLGQLEAKEALGIASPSIEQTRPDYASIRLLMNSGIFSPVVAT